MPSSRAATNLEGTPLGRAVTPYLDGAWYLERYADVAAAGLDAATHFLRYGAAEGRDPNRFFDSDWYARQCPDLASGQMFPLLHYVMFGAAAGRNPHPRFDAEYYMREHPEAAPNPLLFHLRVGVAQGFATEKPFLIAEYLPSTLQPFHAATAWPVDIVLRAGGRLAETRRAVAALQKDPERPAGRLIVVEDRSGDPVSVAWLQDQAAKGRLTLLRSRRWLGLAGCLGLALAETADNDIALIDAATQVQPGWLARLAAQAALSPRIASVSPFTGNGPLCGYLESADNQLPLGPLGWLPRGLPWEETPETLDRACRQVNAGRFVDVPVTDPACLYLRRPALAELRGLDLASLPSLALADFCLRAVARGWTHRLACDVLAHQPMPPQAPSAREAALLRTRHPDHDERIQRHRARGGSTAFRFALTAALLRNAARPVILLVSHDLGGGVRRHVDSLIRQCQGQARFLLLEGSEHHATLSLPELPGHPRMTLGPGQTEDLAAYLASAGVSRVHVHHLLGVGLDVRGLIRRLGVPFDVTLHDYFAICPQRNLLPWEEGFYCGEPGPATCNACIADSGDIERGARDILSWRLEHAWQFQDADRVICPSTDVLRRLARFGLAEKAVVAPHEDQPAISWPLKAPKPGSGPLRVVLLGALANLKGGRQVAALAAASQGTLSLHLIGATDGNFPPHALPLITQTGPYDEAELPALIRAARPHVLWFASTAPETYSYTLTAGIESGLPIVATDLGAFPERLAERPMTWLVDPRASPAELLDVFGEVRRVLANPSAIKPQAIKPQAIKPPRPAVVSGFYPAGYVQPQPSGPTTARPRVAALIVRQPDGTIAPADYVRLLLPLDHPTVAAHYHLVLAEPFVLRHDDIAVVRAAAMPQMPDLGGQAHRLIVDLDCDPALLPVKALHLLDHAAAVWAATPALADAIRGRRRDVQVIETRLDERLWQPVATPPQLWDDPVRLLCLPQAGSGELPPALLQALTGLAESYGERILIEILGADPNSTFPPRIRALRPPAFAVRAYPALVHWLRSASAPWHIGLVPGGSGTALSDDPRRRVLSCAALGLPVVASHPPGLPGFLADGTAGRLVSDTMLDWHDAIDWLMRDQAQRHQQGQAARRAFEASGTLASAAATRRMSLDALSRGLQPADNRLDSSDAAESRTIARPRRRRGQR